MGLKKQRLLEAEQPENLQDGAHVPAHTEPSSRQREPAHLQRSIYFSRPKDHPPRLGSEFFDQPAVSLARALLGQVTSGH